MFIHKKPVRIGLAFLSLTFAGALSADRAWATGISIDAGLTPPENRWIFRSQMRFMQRHDDPTPARREMKANMFPVVIAYGLRSNVAVMVRQAIRRSEMTMGRMTSVNSGLADLLVMGKFRLIRVNTPTYVLGIAPTLGLEIPSGGKDFTSDSWDLHSGCFVSGRMRSCGADFNVAYIWNGMATSGSKDFDPGDEFSVETAVAYQFSFGPDANVALAPVIESSFQKVLPDRSAGSDLANTGESVFWLSPGIKLTRSSLVLEGLVRFPLWQDQEGLQTEHATGFLIGLRLMR